MTELAALRFAVFDFDGVFTDNAVYVSEDGTEAVRCTRSDGIGLRTLAGLGVTAVVISTETNPVVTARARKLEVRCIQGCDDKLAAMAEMLELVTGWNVTADELDETARRIVTAKKAFNVRQGWQPSEDTLPRRFLSEPLRDGAGAGAWLSGERLESLVTAYNHARGWSATGFPPPFEVPAAPAVT